MDVSVPEKESPSSTGENVNQKEQRGQMAGGMAGCVDPKSQKFPFCIVWTPIPLLTWLFPFIGHMGICMSSGVIRDFAGPYYVGEGEMAFGEPTRYLQLTPAKAMGGERGWDDGVIQACDRYKKRMHNLCCDNCHSHVATALENMRYNDTASWNMVKLAAWMFVKGKYVGMRGVLKTWIPFLVLSTIITLTVILPRYL